MELESETVDAIAHATIFAQTNAAFSKIDNATLATLLVLADPVALGATLLRHIIPGKAVRIPEGEAELWIVPKGTFHERMIIH